MARQYSRRSSRQYDRKKPCPGSKIRSRGKGRGLAVGKGRRERRERLLVLKKLKSLDHEYLDGKISQKEYERRRRKLTRQLL